MQDIKLLLFTVQTRVGGLGFSCLIHVPNVGELGVGSREQVVFPLLAAAASRERRRYDTSDHETATATKAMHRAISTG